MYTLITQYTGYDFNLYLIYVPKLTSTCFYRFQFRTYEQNGLIMFNAGKASDFIAIELNNGKLYYTLNLGYGPISIKDTAPNKLSDNKWHAVTIGRPSR